MKDVLDCGIHMRFSSYSLDLTSLHFLLSLDISQLSQIYFSTIFLRCNKVPLVIWYQFFNFHKTEKTILKFQIQVAIFLVQFHVSKVPDSILRFSILGLLFFIGIEPENNSNVVGIRNNWNSIGKTVEKCFWPNSTFR